MNRLRLFSLILKKSIHINCTTKVNLTKLQESTKISDDIIDLLERLSLVDCANEKGIETLEASIQFADQILEINVSENEPLITVLEDQ